MEAQAQAGWWSWVIQVAARMLRGVLQAQCDGRPSNLLSSMVMSPGTDMGTGWGQEI